MRGMVFHLLLMQLSSSNGCRYNFVQRKWLNSALDHCSTVVMLAFVGIPVNDISRISGWLVCYGFHKNDNSKVDLHCRRAVIELSTTLFCVKFHLLVF
ncbi:hypothetical protein C1H46_013149 [Malus baccata]|uniref:Secreted protein n=1 Tax=Malus baccata TaxID=106549 RepID=A0A540MR35_MALBA|nr:hypothetical protein C1H46_013149 [Malus baccata]